MPEQKYVTLEHFRQAVGLVRMMQKALEGCRRRHRYCEDCWYSCPKAEDGCCDKSKGDACNCGADEVNQVIDSSLAAANKFLEVQKG
jgi:hypothetical protein